MRINMIAHGQNVKGQGVGSAYFELVKLLETHAADQIQLSFNHAKNCDFNHIHTIHPYCYYQMSMSKLPSCMHVHFLPETVEGSIKIPKFAQGVFYDYFMKMYRSANELIVVNPIFIEPLTRYDIDPEHITYIPNVVATKDFYPIDRSKLEATYALYDIDPDVFTAISVGQVQTRKGVIDFIEIAKQMPDIQFVWAGGFSFGKITDGYEALKQAIETAPNNVKFVGIVEREQMNALYNICDVFLSTSYNELFPMAILEAINAGLPLIIRNLDLYQQIYFADYLRADTLEEYQKHLNTLKTSKTAYLSAQAVSQKIATDYSETQVLQQWLNYYHGFMERWVK